MNALKLTDPDTSRKPDARRSMRRSRTLALLMLVLVVALSSVPAYAASEDQADGCADWKLTSLKAFDSEETLTIECMDKVVEIRVTDQKVTNEENAYFKVINRSNGNANLQSVTYWTTWK